MISLIKITQAILCIVVVTQLLVIKIKGLSILFCLIILLEFYYLSDINLLLAYIPTTFIWLSLIEKRNKEDALLLSMFSISVYFVSDLLKKTLFVWIYPAYNNYYEMMVIQLILTMMIIRYKRPYIPLNKNVIYHLCLGIASIILVCISFSYLVMESPNLRYMIAVGALCTFIISYLLIKYYTFLVDNLDVIHSLERKNKENKYQHYNQAKVFSTYEKTNQLNHHLKYILLNTKHYISKSNHEEAINYIDYHLQILKNTNTTFTGHPFFDYTINVFEQALKAQSLTCNKTISIKEDSQFNETLYTEQIQIFMDQQLQYCQTLFPETISLIIQEKGDFLSLKTVYYNVSNIDIKIPYTYTYESNVLIVQLILNLHS